MACPYLQVNVSRIFRHSSTNTNPYAIWKLWNAFSSSSKLSQTSGMEYMLSWYSRYKGHPGWDKHSNWWVGFLFPRNPHQPLDAWFQCSTAFPSGPNHFLKYLGHTYYTTMALESHKNMYVNMTYLYIYHIISYHIWFFLLVQPTFFFRCRGFFGEICSPPLSFGSLQDVHWPHSQSSNWSKVWKKNMIQGLGLEGFPLHNLYYFFDPPELGGGTCRSFSRLWHLYFSMFFLNPPKRTITYRTLEKPENHTFDGIC